MLPIDHVTVACASLDPLRAALAAIGIDTVYGGAHRDGVTEMALASFAGGSYLELIALQPGAGPNLAAPHPWSHFLAANAGPCAWAVSTGDLEAEIGRLRASGIAVSGPTSNGRDRPDGVRLEWRIAACGTGAAGSFFPFLIEDVTARGLRACPQGAPANRDFRGIARVVLAVNDLDASLARYRQAYGLTTALRQPDPAFGAHLAVPPDSPIVLVQPLDSDSWLAARLAEFGEAPCAILLADADSTGRAGGVETRWCDLHIRWFDHARLGWRLGSATSVNC